MPRKRSFPQADPTSDARFLVYILQCADGSLYTGYTKDLCARLKLHRSGHGAKYVRSRLPVTLVYCRRCRDIQTAMQEEVRIKSIGRKRKEDLVFGGIKANAPVEESGFLPGFRIVSSPADIGHVECLAREIWTEYFVPIIGKAQVEYMLRTFQSREAVAADISDGYRYYLVDAGGEAEGYLAVKYCPDEEKLFLSKLYLRSACRGKGVGLEMLFFVKALASEVAAKSIFLNINKNNAATIRFYEKFGFVNKGPEARDLGGGFVADDWRMEMPLLTKK